VKRWPIAAARLVLALAVVLGGDVCADPGGDFHGLVDQGEQALRANDANGALRAYERAAALRHDAAAEWGVVRSWMQAGEYRRALAFSAHAAGAHAELAEGAGLYAWLLHIGGQEALAQQTLDAAGQRQPGHPLLVATAKRLRDPAMLPDPRLLEGATRQAPYADTALPPQAHALSSGLLLPTGRHALVPAEAASRASSLWVRDATGHTVVARLVRLLPELSLAELALDAPLREPTPLLPAAPRDAFPGSPQMAVAFAAHANAPAQPMWPLLRIGFVGSWQMGSVYALHAELASTGPQGGPVFDRAGRLIGVALRGGDGRPSLLAASALRGAWPQAFAAPSDELAQMSPDAVYERAMTMVVQLIVQEAP
jgi:hypothetical protein